MTLALAALAVAAGAIAQSVSGIGLTLVSGPLLVVLFGQADGVRVSVVLSLALNAIVLAPEVRRVRWPVLPALLLPAAVATPLAAFTLRRVDPRAAALVAGLVTLAGAALLAAGRTWRAGAGTRGAVAAGTLSGGMNVAAGIGGPAVALYAANAGWAPEVTRPTLQAYFLALNIVAFITLGGHEVAPVLWIALAGGLLVGRVLARRVDAARARRTTLALAAAGGFLVAVRALVQF